ncbi:MAG: hypothetical protein FWF11_03230 [Coriobacteriia bacterium]|nr:hypothetical protein [Coriobacteriia bacterium]
MKEKTQSLTFSTIVKVACVLILLAGFLPFATVSCAGETVFSVSGYQLATGAFEDEAAEMSAGNMGVGMGMGAGQLAALNLLAGVNALLVIAFVGTAFLLFVSLVVPRSKLELMLSLVVTAFSAAAYAQWMVIFSAFAHMFDRAGMGGGPPMNAGPAVGLYLVLALTVLLLLVAAAESLQLLPDGVLRAVRLIRGKDTAEEPVPAPYPAAAVGMYAVPPTHGLYYPVSGQVVPAGYQVPVAGQAPVMVPLQPQPQPRPPAPAPEQAPAASDVPVPPQPCPPAPAAGQIDALP